MNEKVMVYHSSFQLVSASYSGHQNICKQQYSNCSDIVTQLLYDKHKVQYLVSYHITNTDE